MLLLSQVMNVEWKIAFPMALLMTVVTSLILLVWRIHLVLLRLMLLDLGLWLIGHDLLAFITRPFAFVHMRFLLDSPPMNRQHLRGRSLALGW